MPITSLNFLVKLLISFSLEAADELLPFLYDILSCVYRTELPASIYSYKASLALSLRFFDESDESLP